LDKDRKIALAALLAGLIVVFFVSCGDDDGTNLPCENCDFWSEAFGGAGRFPAASPVDPQILAFSSKRAGSGTGETENIWVVRLDEESDTTWFHQITSEGNADYNPAWSPDGQMIAFERNIGSGDAWQVYVVDVSDLENPGIPQAITETDSTAIPYSNRWPSWVTLGGETYISFCNAPAGFGDLDMVLVKYPDLGEPDTISIDPVDYANGKFGNEGGVMSFIFEDEFASSNGTNLLAFTSPNRRLVGDIKIIARSEEQADSSVIARIKVDDKDSGKYTPYVFRYRPIPTDALFEGSRDDYCIDHPGALISESDSLHTYLIDFVHTAGTIAVSTDPGNRFIFITPRISDNDSTGVRTPSAAGQYVYFNCVDPDTYVVWTKSTYGVFCAVDSSVIVTPGDTTFVDFVCAAGAAYQSSSRSSALSSRPAAVAGLQQPRVMQQNARSVWLTDLGDQPESTDDMMYLVDWDEEGLYYPALSPDGKYLAYIRGEGSSWDIIIRDVSEIASGTIGRRIVLGLPGSSEDIECWREIEKISWLPTDAGRKIAASISVCRGGTIDEYTVWIGNLNGFLD
jgi:Tol biopolymer transport system component